MQIDLFLSILRIFEINENDYFDPIYMYVYIGLIFIFAIAAFLYFHYLV